MAKIVCLDAGHFGKYNRSPGVPAYYESERMWKLTQLLAAALKKRGIEVIQTRTNQAVDLALTSRGKKASGCDLFISLHSNAVVSGMNETVDYPVAYVALNGSADDIGKKLADVVATVMGTKQKGRIDTRKGSTGGEYFGVLRGAVAVGVPCLILEHSFHTNTAATNWLLSDGNLAVLAEKEAECIASFLKVKTPAQATQSDRSTASKQKTDAAKSKSSSYAKTYTVKTSLNMRLGAGTNKGIIKTLKKGEKVTCYGYYTKNGSTVWLYVQDSTGTVGFCSKNYLL